MDYQKRKAMFVKKYRSDLFVMRKKIGQMRMDEIKNKTEDPVLSFRQSPKYQHSYLGKQIGKHNVKP